MKAKVLNRFNELVKRASTILTGTPNPIEFTDKAVAVVRYRDGSIIDVVHQVKGVNMFYPLPDTQEQFEISLPGMP